MRPVADLRVPYRDHPDRTLRGVAETDAPTNGSAARDDERNDGSNPYDDAPIRSTAYDIPGFGPITATVAVLVSLLVARRRA
ncbi:hypothetical protein GJ633_09035 [Halorubrum sp. CBA1125]|nr:hypothetical protein [Halorubrum sp. CBA1125]